MTIPTTIFASLPAGDFPAQDFDSSFDQVAALTNIFCACAGTANNLLLTPTATSPAVTSYQDGAKYTFFAAAANTGPLSAAISGLPVYAVFGQNGSQISAANAVTAGSYYELIFHNALNSGAGGLLLLSTVGFSSAVSSVSSGDSSLTVSPTSGAVVAS